MEGTPEEKKNFKNGEVGIMIIFQKTKLHWSSSPGMIKTQEQYNGHTRIYDEDILGIIEKNGTLVFYVKGYKSNNTLQILIDNGSTTTIPSFMIYNL